jgi:hypothetical protein
MHYNPVDFTGHYSGETVFLDVVLHAEKANAQIGTFGFCRPTSQS